MQQKHELLHIHALFIFRESVKLNICNDVYD